jgi:hypothetical protein
MDGGWLGPKSVDVKEAWSYGVKGLEAGSEGMDWRWRGECGAA